MDFGSILSRAWQIIWKHKVLWIFGILAGCGGVGGNAANYRTTYRGDLPPEAQRFFDQFVQVPNWQIGLVVTIIVLVILALVVLAIFLSTIGRIGLIRGTVQANREAAASLSFGELFRDSLPYFWRVFALGLLVILFTILGALLLAVFIAVGTIATLGIGLACIIPLLCLLIPLGWFINIIIEQANVAIVTENLGIAAGVRRAWEIVRNNLGSYIVMGLILYLVVGLIGGFIIGLPVFLIVLPAVLGAVSDTPRLLGGGLLIAGLCFVAYLPVLLLLNGILYGFIQSAWTLTFLDLTRPRDLPEPAPAL